MPTSANNQNLRKLNEVRLPYQKNSDEITPLNFVVRGGGKTVTIKVLNQGEGIFYSDGAGTVPIANNSYSQNVFGAYTIYFKGLINGTIQILNADEISSYGSGSDWSPQNGFAPNVNAIRFTNFDFGQLAVSSFADRINFNNHFGHGDISFLKTHTSLIYAALSSELPGQITLDANTFQNTNSMVSLLLNGAVSFDMNYSPKKARNIDIEGGTLSVIHSGSNANPIYDETDNVASFTLSPANPVASAVVDKVLIALNRAFGNNIGAITIKGSRTAASDVAFNSLIAKGYTVNFI